MRKVFLFASVLMLSLSFTSCEGIDAGCERIDASCEGIDAGCERIDASCEGIDAGCERIDASCEGILVNLYGSERGVDDVSMVTSIL